MGPLSVHRLDIRWTSALAARPRASATSPRLHRRRPDPARGRVRGERRSHPRERCCRQTGRARRGLQRDQPRAGGRWSRSRHVPADAGRGAVGPGDRRALGHPVAAIHTARPRHRGSEGAIPPSRRPRRTARRVRDHRGARGLGSLDGADVGAPRGRRGVGPRRREVARDLRRRRRLLPGPRARRRRSPSRRSSSSTRTFPACGWSVRRSTRTRSCSSIRSSRSTACVCRGAVLGGVGRGTSSPRTGSSRSGS